MLEEKLKLNFPKYGGDVFDQNNDDKFFVYTGEFSNTTNDLNELSIKQFEEYIPLGYKSIQVCKRLKLISNGIIVVEWQNELGNKNEFVLLTEKKYRLYAPNWKREIETTSIYIPNFTELSADFSVWKNIDECIAYGIEFSIKNNIKVLIALRLEIINWH